MVDLKSRDEIAAEIEALRKIKNKVRQFSVFGGDNRAAIAAQIEALEEDMTPEDIEAKEDDDWSQHECEAAMDANNWMNGEEDLAPSKSWASLVGK